MKVGDMVLWPRVPLPSCTRSFIGRCLQTRIRWGGASDSVSVTVIVDLWVAETKFLLSLLHERGSH